LIEENTRRPVPPIAGMRQVLLLTKERMSVEQMRLGRIEFLAMNNPLKRWLQKHVEFRVFRRHLEKHHIDLTGKAILDAGCGSGYGTELIGGRRCARWRGCSDRAGSCW
jgi:hypothetical protein